MFENVWDGFAVWPAVVSLPELFNFAHLDYPQLKVLMDSDPTLWGVRVSLIEASPNTLIPLNRISLLRLKEGRAYPATAHSSTYTMDEMQALFGLIYDQCESFQYATKSSLRAIPGALPKVARTFEAIWTREAFFVTDQTTLQFTRNEAWTDIAQAESLLSPAKHRLASRDLEVPHFGSSLITVALDPSPSSAHAKFALDWAVQQQVVRLLNHVNIIRSSKLKLHSEWSCQ